ncbi:hypothetical protein GOM49_03360 [Clostridium bovifaecis]|uniref:Restriction endonuclease type IV Mrr domain-containing protein n=1 Tax=Clostridium bovifaecis TaxID=2184719 RepID=A0A6I6EQC9_9CLOT|nr:hypothetical protein GOM49_03360 [Clostridium bovifaecis]
MSSFSKLILYTLILISLRITHKLLSPRASKIKETFKEERLMYGLTSRYFLSSLTNSEFEEYCSYLLNKKGYSNIISISEDFRGGISLICSSTNNSKIYVSCIQSYCRESNIDDNYDTIERSDLQKFVGAMIHDNILEAIVITNGNFSKDAIKYIEQLPSRYNIRLIDGIALSKESWAISQKNIKDLSLANLLS